MKVVLKATYDRDINGRHRFLIDRGAWITGAIYISKTEPVPDTITIQLRSKAEAEKEREKN